MTRLQKKCLIAAAGTHLLLVVVVLCSGFIKPRPTPDSSDVLTVIPANLVDALVKSGVRGAQPPPPTPIVQPPTPAPQPPPPQPQPEPPKPEVQPPEPPKPEIQPEDLRPVELPEPKPPKKHEIKPELTVVTRTVPKVTDNTAADAEAEAAAKAKAAKEAKRLRAERVRAFERAASSIRDNASSATTVEMPGTSTVAYANYSSVVLSIYTEAWRVPDSSTSDDAIVKASVTIARDGHVVESHIVDRCGDSSVDNSVQKTLDRVRQIPPFPDDSTDKERTYIINFNLKAKRQMLG